jgi:hypothetical protein
VARLSATLSAAVRSPWSWPLLPLLSVAAVGQWGSVHAAEAIAGAFGAVGLGVTIGLAIVGGQATPRRSGGTQSGGNTPEAQASAASSVVSAGGSDASARASTSPKVADLRGARLANTLLVSADLRQADLRGAILAGADLSGADLTGARLGPLDDDPSLEQPARPGSLSSPLAGS